MAALIFHRSVATTLRTIFSHRSISIPASHHLQDSPKTSNTTTTTTTLIPPPPTQPPDNPNPNPKARTPLDKQFETWITNLKPGFTPSDVDEALRAQSDPDLALDIFRWTAQQRGYKHTPLTYFTMLEITISGKRYRHAEILIEEVYAGACSGSVPLYNAMIKFCCGRKFMFNRAFDIYNKMQKCEAAKPDLETYTLLFKALLNKFHKLPVCYVYLRGVRSLARQMKASGVIPDGFVSNMMIKAFAKCLEVDEAIRIFREMNCLYGIEPNGYTYSYLISGLCEKGRVNEGLGFFKEMRGKGMVPKRSSYMILICSLAMEQRFQEAGDIVLSMIGQSMSPDLLTYKTLLEELCRDGRGDYAFELLELYRKKDSLMNEKTYNTLLNGLHFLNQE